MLHHCRLWLLPKLSCQRHLHAWCTSSPTVLPAAVPYLLKQRDAITNWAAFKAGNNITGWDEATPVCGWSYIHCRQDHTYAVTFSCAYGGTKKCTPRAVGTLAPELARAK